MAVERLRKQLDSVPESRYTYCQEYNSAAFNPRIAEQELLTEASQSKKKWKTSNGFVYPGMKTAKESNEHPMKLHPARLSELEKVCT